MKTKYIADDGQNFSSEKDCARHELANCEGVLEKLEAGIAKSPREYQMNWCGSGACACMGCINREFYEMNLTQSHWEVWMEEFRKELPMGKEPTWDQSRDYDEATVVLKTYGEDKATVATVIRRITGLGTVEAYGLLAPDSEVKIGIAYVDAKLYKTLLEKAGATVEIMEYMPKKTIKLVKK